MPVVLALISVLLFLPLHLSAQGPALVFNQLTVSSEEASMVLEFEDGTSLSATLRDGRVLVDGSDVGAFTPGGALESSWRSLLSGAVSADNGQLLELLRNWDPPSGMSPDEQSAAAALSAEFEQSLRTDSEGPGSSAASASLSSDSGDLLQGILLEPDYLRALTAAALDREFGSSQVVVNRDFRVSVGDTLDGSLVALNSELDVEGMLDGDLLLLGGRLRMGPEGRITGDLRWSDAALDGDLDAIAGGAHEIEPVLGLTDQELGERIRSEVRSATSDLRRDRNSSSSSPFRGLARGVGGVFQAVVSFTLFLAVGLGILHFFPRELDVVSRTAAHAPGRSFLVGVAGAVLALPIWISGIVLLAVTIIGIPGLIIWIPAVPIAVAGLMIFGFVAMSRNVGQWISARNLQGLDDMDTSRPAMQIGLGLLALLGAFAIAGVLQIGGMIFSPFAVLFTIAGYVAALVAGSVGFGAVLLSRAGRDGGYGRGGWDPDPWAPSPDPFRPDPNPEPTRRPAGDEGPRDGAAQPSMGSSRGTSGESAPRSPAQAPQGPASDDAPGDGTADPPQGDAPGDTP